MTAAVRRRALVALVAVLLTVTGCAGLPTGGPVVAGPPVNEQPDAPAFAYLPDAPVAGASREQIVSGFLAAGSGPRDNWGTAREFLAESVRQTWQPTARATIDLPGRREVVADETGRVQVTLTEEASVDASGALSPSDGGTTTLDFELVEENGEWRISQVPDGVVLDRARFQAVYREYSVMYFDPTWTYLVPDRRWLPATNAATYLAEALIDGEPSPWLAGAVANAFPESLEMASRAVPLEGGVAQVPLSRSMLSIVAETRDRMQTQLEATLQSAGILDAQMLVDDEPVEARAVGVRPVRVDQRPLVLTEGGFGFLSGNALEEIPGLSDTIPDLDAQAIQVDPDRTNAAVRTAAGAIVRVRADGSFVVHDQRAALIDPTIDPQGYIWSSPEGDPAGLVAYSDEGTAIALTDVWPGATQVTAMDVSRDGTRLAAVVRDGGRPALWVAGILRDEEGTPVGLGERETVTMLPAAGLDLGWVDGSTLGVLLRDGSTTTVLTQSVGGFGDAVRAPGGAVSIAGANTVTAVRLRDDEGTLFAQRGATWPTVAADVEVLAEQQGAPR